MEVTQRTSGAPLSAGTEGEAERRLLPDELEAEYEHLGRYRLTREQRPIPPIELGP